jgi:hypothetical protein
VEHVANIFHELVENYRTSKPVNYPITEDQADQANDIASQAEVFIFAHELGHILTSSESLAAERPGEEEYEADRIALELVLGCRHQPLFIPTVKKVYAGAVFAVRVWAGLERLGYQFTGTHPPPSKRLKALREHAVRLFGGRATYLRNATLSISIDRLLEAVERTLAGFDLRERTEQVVANIMAMIIECAKGHLDESKAGSILADELVETMDEDRRTVAKEAAALFCPVQDEGTASSQLEKEAECYGKLISFLPFPSRELFLDEWKKACTPPKQEVDPTSRPASPKDSARQT